MSRTATLLLSAALILGIGLGLPAYAAEFPCDDGIDNDLDGLVDLDDPDCRDDLVLFPIPDGTPTDVDITDPERFRRISKDLQYTFDPVFTGSTFQNLPGEILPYTVTVRFLGLQGEEVPAGTDLLITITSLREGPFAGPPDPLPPRASAGYLLDSFLGPGLETAPLFVRDASPGQLTDEEGNVFIGLEFPAVVGPVYTFDLEIMLTGPLQDPAEFKQFVAGFLTGRCGDGELDPGEECDDGNTLDGDCCAATCRLEPDESPCDDASACTESDACVAGACVGDAVGCDDGEVCTADSCDPATGCVNDPVAPGTACDDGLFCTVGDSCADGACRPGPPLDCSSLDGACTIGECDEAASACVARPANEGGSCDDGLFCTTGETCAAGLCLGGAPTDCSGLDGQCRVGVCNEAANACEPAPANETEACDDGLFCTTGETCTGGSCGGGDPTDCSGLDDQCVAGVCNEGTNACEPEPIGEGGACNDGLFCTTGETCTGGTCGGGDPTDCSGLDDQCLVGVCNEGTNGCEPEPANETEPCNDGLFCTTGETCTGGSCGGGAPTDCSALDDECVAGVCNEGANACQPEPIGEGGACNDGLFCTTGETCSGGTCGGGGPTDCSALDDQCLAGVCNEGTNACEPAPANENETCDDGLFCTTGETCTGGTCGGGAPTDCSALDDQCVAGACNEGTNACEPEPIGEGGACDDGLFCTTGETCTGGTCGGGAPTDCSALDDQCLTGVCNEGANACEPEPIDEGGACDDGLFCTAGETCGGGMCGGGAPIDCSDLDGPCSVGACEEDALGCVGRPVNDGQPCEDGQFCTSGERCVAGVCAAGEPTDCSSLDGPCAMGICDEAAARCVGRATGGGAVCRPASGPCDVEESCDGDSTTCPPDDFLSAGTLCRASVGTCDPEERCTGSGSACPGDARESAATVCRPGQGACDREEVCDGVSPECPPDEIESAGAVCRPAVDLCDFEEACDGVGSACPPDLGLPDGTPCGGDDVCFTAECVAARCEVASRNPDDPNAPPPADFVFLIDTSRSMRRHLGIWLPEHLCAFPGLLEEAGIVDYRLAVVRFGTNRDPTVSGGKFPEVLLPCTDDPLRFCETITALQNDIQARTESGTEAMQFALSDPNTLGCRKAAFRNVILYTDEDDDSPATSGERKSPPGRGIRCYGRFCGKRWPAFQQRIDDAAALLIEQRAHLHMVESPRDAPTKSQYGDPTCTVTRPDGSQDPSAMLECLLRPTRFGNVSPVGICDGGLCTQGRRGEPCGSDSDCNAYSLQIHLLASGQCAGGVCTGGHVGFPCSEDADCALPAQAYRVPRGVNAAETLFREQLFPDIIRQQVCPAP